ncbi:MAG: hypothetical protein QOF68_2902 [Gaiellales bacterium]|nr:hypothetical protein [Gaiellales bacterium]
MIEDVPARAYDTFLAALCTCEGFSVVGPHGLVGVVYEMEYGSRSEFPDHLIVEDTVPRRRLILSSTAAT